MDFQLSRSESKQYFSARGSKSRNKVAVGEPAAGSLPKSVLVLLGGQSDQGLSKAKIFPKASAFGVLTCSGPSRVTAGG